MRANNLEEYLTRYGQYLGDQADEQLKPLWDGKSDPNLPELKRECKQGQDHVVRGICEAWRRQKAVFVSAECGTGKTQIAIAAVHAHAEGRPYRAVVYCPGHIVKKWQREIEAVCPAQVTIIRDYRQALAIPRSLRGAEWFVISLDKGKLGAERRGAWVPRKGEPACPHCHTPIRVRTKEERELVKGLYEEGSQIPNVGVAQKLELLEKISKRTRVCHACDEQLWSMRRSNKIKDRYAPVQILKDRYPKGFFRYCVLDEVHQTKSDAAIVGNAAGALISSCNKVVCLTGTLIGGYAEHIRPLLLRLDGGKLREMGHQWNGATEFNREFGRLDTVIVERDSHSKVSGKGSSVSKTQIPRPGIMPTLFGKCLIDKTVFLGLADVATDLPVLKEEVLPVVMDEQMGKLYSEMEGTIRRKVKEMWTGGQRKYVAKILGPMLQTLLGWTDLPQGWKPIVYQTDEGSEWHTIAIPPKMDLNRQFEKEKALIRRLKQEKIQGRQCWVFLEYTGKHNVQGRIENLLKQEGLKVGVLKSSVPPEKRESWIRDHGKNVDVMISHPKLVETGLDLFSPTHNFCTIIFYEQGYNCFTLRQASRRAWRIGQDKECRVVYMHYENTMQASALDLISKKIAASEAIEGKFSEEGLAAHSDEGSVQMALAKQLAESIERKPIKKTRPIETPATIKVVAPKKNLDWISRVRGAVQLLKERTGA